MATNRYSDSVFINVPFDAPYRPLLYSLVFSLHDCGLLVRCALEDGDCSRIRVQKIFELIKNCRLGVHDISRTTLDKKSRFPRFNMPLELGIFLGAKQYGRGQQKRKSCLILEKRRYSSQVYCSDLAGQDVASHNNDPKKLVECVRNWASSHKSPKRILPGGRAIYKRYLRFTKELPVACKLLGLTVRNLSFNDYTTLVTGWLSRHPWPGQYVP